MQEGAITTFAALSLGGLQHVVAGVSVALLVAVAPRWRQYVEAMLTTPTARILIVKLLLNSVVSTPG